MLALLFGHGIGAESSEMDEQGKLTISNELDLSTQKRSPFYKESRAIFCFR